MARAADGQRQDRQATPRATLDGSWDLLQPAERTALAQLSVFEGGFTLAAAEAEIDFSGVDSAPWIVDALDSRVDESPVQPRRSDRFDLLALSAARRGHAE